MIDAAGAVEMLLRTIQARTPIDRGDADGIRRLPISVEPFKANCDILRSGEVGKRAVLILDGLAARCAIASSGDRHITSIAIPGDLANLAAVIAPGDLSSLSALTPTTVGLIPRADLLELARTHPQIAVALWRQTAVDATIAARWANNVARKKAVARLAHLLCDLAKRYSEAGIMRGDVLHLPITQQQIADVLALTGVHVNRCFKILRDTGLIDVDHHSIRLLDRRGLDRLGEFDARQRGPAAASGHSFGHVQA